MTKNTNQDFIDSIVECITACAQCTKEDLEENMGNMMSKCITLNQECVDLCMLMLKAQASESDFLREIAKLCIKVCNACATECEKHEQMVHCKKCAEACRKCADECALIINSQSSLAN